MDVRGLAVTVEVDAEDIQHLMSNGSTGGDDSKNVSIKCQDHLQFEVVGPDGEPWEEGDG